jgi:drug/metabolite transporter (DMT)-like permease
MMSVSRALAYLWLANILGGLSYAGMRLALDGLPEITIIELRILVALPCFALLLKGESLRWPYHGRDLVLLLIIAIGGFAAPLALGIIGVKLASVANASILVLLEPIGIVVLAALFLGERPRAGQVLGIALGLTGATLVVLSGAGGPLELGRSALTGNLILALHGFLWSLFTVTAKPLLERHSPLSITYCASIVALIALAPFVPLELRGRPLFHGPVWTTLFWVVALGVLVSFGSTLLWVEAVRVVRPIVIAAFVFVQPLVGSLAGYFLGERLSPFAMMGAALICLAVFVVTRGERETERAPEPTSVPPRPGELDHAHVPRR